MHMASQKGMMRRSQEEALDEAVAPSASSLCPSSCIAAWPLCMLMRHDNECYQSITQQGAPSSSAVTLSSCAVRLSLAA